MRGLVGQGYDGAAAMGGHLNGVRTAIQEQYPMALYVHCAAHSLNLALSKSCTVPLIRNSVGMLKEVEKFFRSSAQRSEVLKSKISEEMPTSRHSQLISMCDTRWVERHESISRFVEMYTPVVHALEELEESARVETSKQAHQLLNVITRGSFVLAVIVAEKFFAHTLPLCTALQKVSCDLAECCGFVKYVIQVLTDMRTDAQTTFDEIFNVAQQMTNSVGGDDIAVPRIVGRQTRRDNVPAADANEYYRLSLFVSFLDFLISELHSRFSAHADVLSSLQAVLPQHCNEVNSDKIAKCAEFYGDLLPDPNHLASEMVIWKQKWRSTPDEEKKLSALESFISCSDDFFPNIKAMLGILATLPVSTATAERSFSTLKRIKTYLRNSMGHNRLSGLALLSIHREIYVEPSEVLDRFAKAPRRCGLLI